MTQILYFILLLNVLNVLAGIALNATKNEQKFENLNGLCHFIPTFLPFIVDNILCSQPSIYQQCPRTCNLCSEVGLTNNTSYNREIELSTGNDLHYFFLFLIALF